MVSRFLLMHLPPPSDRWLLSVSSGGCQTFMSPALTQGSAESSSPPRWHTSRGRRSASAGHWAVCSIPAGGSKAARGEGAPFFLSTAKHHQGHLSLDFVLSTPQEVNPLHPGAQHLALTMASRRIRSWSFGAFLTRPRPGHPHSEGLSVTRRHPCLIQPRRRNACHVHPTPP